jgi:diguanylate cyclase (GGDEF)-like protein
MSQRAPGTTRTQRGTPDATASHAGAPERSRWERATLDATGDGYTVLRAVREGDAIVDWVVVDANALVRGRWEWVLGDVVGRRVSELDAAASNTIAHDEYERALTTGQRQVTEVELHLPGGHGGWRRLIVTPIDRDTVSAVTRDISREHHLESALDRERAHHFKRAFAVDDGPDDAAERGRFASRTAAVLFLGSGLIAMMNSLLADLPGVDMRALRVTALCSIAAAPLIALLPWKRYFTLTANSIVVGTIAFLAISDWFDRYSRTEAAVAVYPVFFILLIAWTGSTRRRGVATIAACASAPALYWMLAHSGRSTVGWQCLIVTLPVSAALGEVLSWNASRARMLTKVEMQRRLHDPLTGLANRVMLSAQLDHALARARRGLGSVAVLYIDVDHFKRINDSAGHAVGDDVLIATAERLRTCARETDTIARVGGDEFVLVCEDLATVMDATEIAQRVLDSVKQDAPGGPPPVPMSFSIGIALSDLGDETTAALLQTAALALYRAKQEGRARFEVFGEALRQQVTIRRELEVALREGIPRDELCLHYQPIVSSATGDVVGFEALARWHRPGYGLVPPGEFIPVAEESGLIVTLGTWVLHAACREAATWARRWPGRDLGVSVNVSAHQLRHGDIVDVVRHALDESGLDPHLLTLELTESSFIDHFARVEPLLRELRDLGVDLAIDDFGTGYSSLTYLRHLPINQVKVDQSFVRAIGTDREDTAIVAAVIGLARNLGLHVVAEGIETPEQLATLVHLGCEHLQGYFFSRPVPVTDLAPLVEHDPAWIGPDGDASFALQRRPA